MRCTLLTLFVCVGVLLSGSAAAADGDTGLVGKGIKGGLTLVKFLGDDVDLSDPFDGGPAVSPDFRTGFAVGGYLVVAVASNVSVQPEVLFIRKGAKYKGSGDLYIEELGGTVTADWEATLTFDYVEIPVLFRITAGSGSDTRPYFLAGPAIAFKTSSKEKAKVSAMGQSVELEEDIDEGVKSTDFGVLFGAGLEFPLGSATGLVEARYELGLTSLDDTSDEVDIKNGGFQFLAGFGF